MNDTKTTDAALTGSAILGRCLRLTQDQPRGGITLMNKPTENDTKTDGSPRCAEATWLGSFFMNLTQNITIQVNVPRPETEGERLMRCAQGWQRAIGKMAENKIAHEKKVGNPLFSNIETWDQYVAALDSDEKRKRKELGFWRYHFGS